MSRRIPRRDVLKAAAALGAGVWLGVGPKVRAQGVQDKLNLAFVGVGGRALVNINELANQNIVAFCDVDETRGAKAFDQWPNVKRFQDFRKLLDDMHTQIDGVVVSTPDHTHFHPSRAAMLLGKHLYLEKPLAHSVWEVRELANMARDKKIATQLGMQRHVNNAMRRTAELIQSGAIGQVKEVHSWCGGSRGMPDAPKEFPPVPSTLNWDLWLGPADDRPYSAAYCPYNWRFWWDFGTGETGNWGCHILDIPYWALGLKYPTRVEATGPEIDPQRTPKSMTCKFEFPADAKRPAVALHWYHGRPPIMRKLREADDPIPSDADKGANNLFIGTEGMLLAGFNMFRLLPEEKFKDHKGPEPFLPKSPGFWQEWIDSCKGGKPATCNFDYSAPMTETVLLGNVAYRTGKSFDWDALTLTPSEKAAEPYIRPPFRKGWQV